MSASNVFAFESSAVFAIFFSDSNNDDDSWCSSFSFRRVANKNATAKFTAICSLTSSTAAHVLSLMHERVCEVEAGDRTADFGQ